MKKPTLRGLFTACTVTTLLLLTTFLWVSPSSAQPPGRHGSSVGASGGGAVTLYADAHFRGASQTFDRDIPNLQRNPFGNDRASSVVVAPGCQVTLFSDADFRGRSAVVEGNVAELNRTSVGNDSVSSLRVDCRYGNDGGYGNPPGHGGYQESGVTLYSGVNFSGRSETFHRDDSRFYNNQVGDNQARSIRVAPGCRATLFDVPDYGGRSLVVDYDIADLGRTNLGNNVVSSIQVRCSATGNPGYGNPPGQGGPGYGNPPGGARPGVTLYSDDRFRGVSETFYGDVNSMKRSSLGNDRASSVRVSPGCRAVLYSDSDFRGAVTVIDYDLGNLNQTEVGNDQVSSLQVDCRRRR